MKNGLYDWSVHNDRHCHTDSSLSMYRTCGRVGAISEERIFFRLSQQSLNVDSTDVPVCRHSTRLWARSSSSPLIFLHNTRCSTHAYHSRRQKFCCCRTARVEQFTGYYKTDHQLRTVLATSENTFIHGLEIIAHCDSWLLCAIQILSLTCCCFSCCITGICVNKVT